MGHGALSIHLPYFQLHLGQTVLYVPFNFAIQSALCIKRDFQATLRLIALITRQVAVIFYRRFGKSPQGLRIQNKPRSPNTLWGIITVCNVTMSFTKYCTYSNIAVLCKRSYKRNRDSYMTFYLTIFGSSFRILKYWTLKHLTCCRLGDNRGLKQTDCV